MFAKRFFYVCAGLFLLALTYHLGARSAGAQPGGKGRTVEADRFVLRDPSGTVRGTWEASGNATRFQLTDGNGNAIALQVVADKPIITLSHATSPRMMFVVEENGQPTLTLAGGDRKAQAMLTLLTSGGALVLMDANGRATSYP